MSAVSPAAVIAFVLLPFARASNAFPVGKPSSITLPCAARAAHGFGDGFAVQSLVALWLFERFDMSLGAASAFFFWSNTLAAFSYPVAALSQMDVPTRTSFVMAVATPAERPATASVTAVPRSLAAAISPTLSGALLSTAFAGLPLVVCGGLKIVYDIALPISFRHLKPPEERGGAGAASRGRGFGHLGQWGCSRPGVHDHETIPDIHAGGCGPGRSASLFHRDCAGAGHRLAEDR